MKQSKKEYDETRQASSGKEGEQDNMNTKNRSVQSQKNKTGVAKKQKRKGRQKQGINKNNEKGTRSETED